MNDFKDIKNGSVGATSVKIPENYFSEIEINNKENLYKFMKKSVKRLMLKLLFMGIFWLGISPVLKAKAEIG